MEQLPKRNWWSRNWKWFVPAGCLTSILMVGCVIAIAAVSIFSLMKSSDVYKEALVIAKSNDEVKSLLGEPIEDGLMMTGNIETSGPAGKADIAIPISGLKGSATLYAVAEKTAGKWNYSTLEVGTRRVRHSNRSKL